MLKRIKLAGVALAVAALGATPALAAQIIPVDFSTPDANGVVYGSAAFDWPGEGMRATVRIDFVNLELVEATLTGNLQGQATWWDPGLGGVTGNEYQLALDCGISDGCLSQQSPTLATGRIATPRGFDVPCTPTTLGNCSFHYTPQFGVFDSYFRVLTPATPYSALLTVSDFSAIPEPSAWVLSISGFGLLGGAVRRRQQQLRARIGPFA